MNILPLERSPSHHTRAQLIRLWIAVVLLGGVTAFVTFVLRPHRWERGEVPAAQGSHAG